MISAHECEENGFEQGEISEEEGQDQTRRGTKEQQKQSPFCPLTPKKYHQANPTHPHLSISESKPQDMYCKANASVLPFPVGVTSQQFTVYRVWTLRLRREGMTRSLTRAGKIPPKRNNTSLLAIHAYVGHIISNLFDAQSRRIHLVVLSEHGRGDGTVDSAVIS